MKSKYKSNKISSRVNNKALTQLQRVNRSLVEISKDVITEDRKAAIEDKLLSEPHLIRYLSGKGTKLTKALALFKFLKDRIENREKELARA